MMSRKKEFSVDGSGEEELKRRKLKAIRQCLKILEEDFAEPSYGRSDLCRMPKDMNVKELHDDVKDEETDLLSSTEVGTALAVKLGLIEIWRGLVYRRPFSPNTGEKNAERLVSSSGGQKCKRVPAPSTDTENKTVEDIDEALWMGVCSLSYLQDADEVLKCLELKAKEEGDKVAEIVDKKFDEFITSVLSRKKKLCAELVKSIDDYSADIAKAKQFIEEKKKCLMGAIRIAKELKTTPSVRAYCDLTQVIYDLKLPVDTELSRVNSLKEKAVPRLFLNTDEITSLLKNMGNIDWETSVHEDNGKHSLTCDGKEEIPSCDNQIPVDSMFPAPNRESKMKALASKLGVDEGMKNVQVQESLAVVHHQNVPAIPKPPSSPDVIIEEIFEDYMEKRHPDEQKKELFKKETCSEHKAGSKELVFVSHVVNPCHFYIRRYSQKKEGVLLEKKLNRFCCNKSSCFLPSDILELGVRAFIKSKETGMWCRGTITKLIPMKAKDEQKTHGPVRCRVCETAAMEIFLMDFGSLEVLNFSSRCVSAGRPDPGALQTVETDEISSLVRKPDKHVEAELAAIPPLAVRCSLKDIVPKNASEGWGEEAKKKFLAMVNNKVVLMTIFREEDGVLIVDLRKPPYNKISNDMPLSLKDTLVFLDLARFKSNLPNHLENSTVCQYSPPKMPQEGEVVSVIVCHISSPSDFYLQLADVQDDLAFPKKIEETHKHKDSKDLTVVCPVEGQACIAKRKNGNWYRAQIIGLPRSQEVVVKYVDFGDVANVTLTDIRKVEDEFLSFPVKAIRCRLAYVEPYEAAEEWSRGATERFKEMTADRFMVCSVVEILDNILSVELFDSHAARGSGSSVNCQLVEDDLAAYIPGYIEIWDASPEVPENLKAINTKALEEQDLRSLLKKELQVIVSHVVSPSKIFVQSLSSESKLKSLQEKMATLYKESQPPSVKWESGMHCVVYVCDLNQWHRGQISRIVSETTAEVLLYDSGAEKTVDISCLRKLEKNLKRSRALAIECSLVDISPTGGSTQWTATVCECISYYLTGVQAKVIVQEVDVAGALPVRIVCKDEAGQWMDISEHLIKKGLAFKNTRTEKAAVACAVPKKHPSVRLEQENPQLNSHNSKPAHARSCSDGEGIVVSKSEQKSQETSESLLPLGRDEVYKAPVVPEARTFQAVVSCVERDGTIYVIPKSFESELNKLMVEIQSNFKCLGLLEPYSWKKEEACVVRGSDTRWYRGKIVELGGGTLLVEYVDHGCTERVPQCHLYPTTLYTAIPPFCIPCALHQTIPIGNFWQQDAVDLLQELLTNEEVEVHVQELPEDPWGKLSVRMYFDGMSVSSFMAHQKFCVAQDCQDLPKQELVEKCTPALSVYTLPQLPVPGEIFPVRVTHFVTPKEVYICLAPREDPAKQPAVEGDAKCLSELESLDEALKWCNDRVDTLPLLTDFRTEMPCLVEYKDGLWYRAKFLSVEEFDPVKILIQFVDYGNFSVVPTSKLRHIPHHLLQYPVQAVQATLAGFKPPLRDTNIKRIPYCPEWSVEALWAMMDCTEGKQLSASILALSPEVTITLYEDDQKPVHMKLVEMGLADLEE
ncbi:RNF17 protein, partial [Penelope pileata]|nr:RNF17 protein [Penelope pileata]